MSNTRFEAGLRRLNEIDGEAGVKVIAALESIAPDLAH